MHDAEPWMGACHWQWASPRWDVSAVNCSHFNLVTASPSVTDSFWIRGIYLLLTKNRKKFDKKGKPWKTKNWWNSKKKWKVAFFEKSIFGIFRGAKKSKNRIIKNVKISSNDPKFYRGMSKKGIKYNIWTIWTIPENFFFSPSRCWLVKIFVFCKKPWKK